MCMVKTQVRLGGCLVFTIQIMKKLLVLGYPQSAQQRFRSECIDVQADLSLCCCTHTFESFAVTQFMRFVVPVIQVSVSIKAALSFGKYILGSRMDGGRITSSLAIVG